MKYHPGGKAQLMRGAGNDCTQLFDKVPDYDTMDYYSYEQPGGGRKGLLLLKLMLNAYRCISVHVSVPDSHLGEQ